MLEGERIADYLRSKLPQTSDVIVENVFHILGGASRETWSFDTRQHERGRILEQLVIGPHAPAVFIGLAERIGAN